MMIESIIKELEKNKIITDKGCWKLKNVPLDPDGYHILFYKGIHYRVSRISAAFYLKLNFKNKKELALHKNECNDKACWNPEHLYVGDARDNSIDRHTIGRGNVNFGRMVAHINKNKTHCKKGHEYTKENTYITSAGGRACRQCMKLYEEKRQQFRTGK